MTRDYCKKTYAQLVIEYYECSEPLDELSVAEFNMNKALRERLTIEAKVNRQCDYKDYNDYDEEEE